MEAVMAKKKPKPALEKVEVLAFRCSTPFKEALEKIAKKETRTPTLVIERALREYAEKHGHEEFPER